MCLENENVCIVFDDLFLWKTGSKWASGDRVPLSGDRVALSGDRVRISGD